MKTYRFATVPGDGIGKEVISAGRQVLEALAGPEGSIKFDFENFGWGGNYFPQHGEMMPDSGAGREPGHCAHRQHKLRTPLSIDV